MIETMNKQQAKFKNKIREVDLSHETDLRFSFAKLDVCLCDDGPSFTPLESGQEAVLDPSLTAQSLVASPSPSILRDNIAFNMALPDPPLPLPHSMKFEIGETFTVNASVDEDDVCYDSENVLIEVHDFDATLAERSYVDVMITMPASSDMVDNISTDPLVTLHASPSCSLPSPSLSVITCYFLNIMLCLRGKRLTV